MKSDACPRDVRHSPAAGIAISVRLAGRLDPESREAHELLESLDDAMFEAIAGDEAAFIQARDLWDQAASLLCQAQVEESREQYLRYAVETTRQNDENSPRDPSKTLAAIEIIGWLTHDV